MNKKKKGILVAVWVAALILTAVGAVLVGSPGGEKESIKEAMRDAVLHERNVISLFGIKTSTRRSYRRCALREYCSCLRLW